MQIDLYTGFSSLPCDHLGICSSQGGCKAGVTPTLQLPTQHPHPATRSGQVLKVGTHRHTQPPPPALIYVLVRTSLSPYSVRSAPSLPQRYLSSLCPCLIFYRKTKQLVISIRSPRCRFWQVLCPFARPRVRAKVPVTWKFLIINPGAPGSEWNEKRGQGSCVSRPLGTHGDLGRAPQLPASILPLPCPCLAILCQCAPCCRGPEQHIPWVYSGDFQEEPRWQWSICASGEREATGKKEAAGMLLA